MIVTDPAERAQLEAKLARLETAYEEMISGARLSSVSAPGGRGMGFAAGTPAAAMAEIAKIKRQLGRGGGRVAFRPYF